MNKEIPEEFSSEFELALFRSYYRAGGSGALSAMRTIERLCNHIAFLNNWDLDRHNEAVEIERKRRSDEEEQLAKEAQEQAQKENLAKSRQRFYKKHGHWPEYIVDNCAVCIKNNLRKNGNRNG